jgi:hypothetical protein
VCTDVLMQNITLAFDVGLTEVPVYSSTTGIVVALDGSPINATDNTCACASVA